MHCLKAKIKQIPRKTEQKEDLFMINIIRVGRERLKEAYEIVNKVDQGMNVPEWFVAEPYEEFDFWMREERGLLYLAVDEDENVGAMFFVILPGLHPDNLGYDLSMEEEQLKLCAMMDTAAVLPEFRGHHLQYEMMQHAEEDLRQRGYQYLLCTVHPENVFSRTNVMKQGYKKMLTKEKYGGFLRDIWMKNIIE